MTRFRRCAFLCACVAMIASPHISAQLTRTLNRQSANPTPAPPSGPGPNLDIDESFNSVQEDRLAFMVLPIHVAATQYLVFTMPATETVQPPTDNSTARKQQNASFAAQITKGCDKAAKHSSTCAVVLGFYPNDTNQHSITVIVVIKSGNSTIRSYMYDVSGTGVTATDAAGQQAAASAQAPAINANVATGPIKVQTVTVTNCVSPDRFFLPTIRSSLLDPSVSPPDGSEKAAKAIADGFGVDMWGINREATINCFYQTAGQLAFFTRVQSVYNSNSASTTVSANVGSFNFNNGFEVTLGTNIQAGSANPNGATAAPSTAPAPGQLATLTKVAAAQAAQNLFYGGNIFLYADLPVFAVKNSSSGRFHIDYDLLFREGVDLQNFSGASTTANSPPTHFDAVQEGYWQYDADPATATAPVPFAVWLGGQYGYAFTSHAYARDYGFFNKSNADLGEAAFGLIVTGQFNISVMREFGPTQQYKDSVSGTDAKVNNFKSWSFSIQYQTKGLTPSQ